MKLIFSFFFLFSCSHKIGLPEYPPDYQFEEVYKFNFNLTWTGLIKLLSLYPELALVDKKKGLVITKWSEEPYNKKLFDHPLKSDLPTQFRSRLLISVIGGSMDEYEVKVKSKSEEKFVKSESATKVVIQKELVKENIIDNSFSESYYTDGYEERIFLYRLGRILQLTSANQID